MKNATFETLTQDVNEVSRAITRLNDHLTDYFSCYSDDKNASMAQVHAMMASTAVGKVQKALYKFKKEKKGEEQK